LGGTFRENKLMIRGQKQHAVLPSATHDEAARQDFMTGLRVHVMREVSAGNRTIYDSKVRPRFQHAYGRAPADRHEVRREMNREPYHQAWGALLRTTQEMMWESVGSPIERQLDDLIARNNAPKARAGGSLQLDPGLEVPRYQTATDIHVMPGSYHSDLCDGDLTAGAIYDKGLYIYAMGGLGDSNQDIGRGCIAYLKQEFPDLKPQRILDLGCTVGHSTVPFVAGYPGAEVYGIDIGAASLRYAHARAESLGASVHFSQRNAEDTDFPDGHFDLIVSHVLLHETSSAALPRIIRECRRLLAPGGVMTHCDVPQREGDAFDLSIPDWDTYNNNEPFMGRMRDTDLRQLFTDSGFARNKYFDGYVPNDKLNNDKKVTFRGGDGKKGKPWAIYGARA
jgi:ubiquinone/menaquinone biosynthesis C-methylase UbiE